ncbi:MAG: 2-hydroxyacyl-CoA dehydratase [Sedimentisphaerales bacterium]|nr:2-hydroxyacyl-CoA dehydratase [Sedimentisphaerales bacterium]
MASSKSILAKIFAEYYLSGAQARQEGRPIAYVTAFTPVEILRAMDVVCLFPESYAVVCSASNKSQEMIQASTMASFSQDLCSYSLISFGADHYPRPPYGGLPRPDMLIATNNQCGTTFLWFKLLSQKQNIPLFIIDYPAANPNQSATRPYIEEQYKELIKFVQKHTDRNINTQELNEQIICSRKACDLWLRLHELNKEVPPPLTATEIVDSLFPMLAAKGTPSACDFYEALIEEKQAIRNENSTDSLRLLWHGYPMWFLRKRFPDCFDDAFQVVLNDYTLWWNLDYPDEQGDMDALISAYSKTYLNRTLNHKIDWVDALARDYSVDGVICHANRSCRRALADIVPLRDRLHKKEIPSVIIESDMAHAGCYSGEQVKLRIESFRESLSI